MHLALVHGSCVYSMRYLKEEGVLGWVVSHLMVWWCFTWSLTLYLPVELSKHRIRWKPAASSECNNSNNHCTRTETCSLNQTSRYTLSSLSPETQQLQCCTINWNFLLTYLRARRVGTKTTSGLVHWEEWYWQRNKNKENKITCAHGSNMQHYPTGRLAPMKIKFLPPHQFSKSVFSPLIGVI